MYWRSRASKLNCVLCFCRPRLPVGAPAKLLARIEMLTSGQQRQPLAVKPLLWHQGPAKGIDLFFGLQQRVHHLFGPAVPDLFIQAVMHIDQLAQVVCLATDCVRTAAVCRLGAHHEPACHIHFTPTSSSWLNMVERFFRDITDKRIRRGVFTRVAELEAAINEYIAVHNAKPKPFIWTAKASDILAKVTRPRATLNKNTSI